MKIFFRMVRIPLSLFILGLERLFPGVPKQKRSVSELESLVPRLNLLELYQFEACPFCVKVRRHMRQLDLAISLKDASRGSAASIELEQSGGMLQVPCLKIRDPHTGESRWLYESDQINQYLSLEFPFRNLA